MDSPCAAWLNALIREARDVDAEIILAGELARLDDSCLEEARRSADTLCLLRTAPDVLAPVLWGMGLSAASGTVVAFTVNQCTVQAGWARALLGGLAAGDAGVGGRVDLDRSTSRTGRAVYFLRYSAFAASVDGPRRQVNDIAGDNAGYRRDVLLRYAERWAHGFWEVEVHHFMRADGETLALVPGMRTTFGGAPRLGTFLRQRFAHGRHFGAWRVLLGGRRPWQVALACPLVPFILLLRTARRLAGVPDAIAELGASIIPFLLLGFAWAIGEAVGALHGDAHVRSGVRPT
jgi:hypothetical protein